MDIPANTTTLNSNKYVSEKTGMSIPQCKRYQDILSGNDEYIQLYWRDSTKGNKKVPIINITQGARTSNFTFDQTKAIIENKAMLS